MIEIQNSSNNFNSKRILRKLNKCIVKSPICIQKIFNSLDIKIKICNMFAYTGKHALGCYFISKNNRIILIDNNVHNVNRIFYHELGHLLDDYIKEFNHLESKFSISNKDFINANLSENDFFIGFDEGITKDELFYHDLQESFADCFAEMMTNTRNFKMFYTKAIIKKEILNISSKIS